MPHLCFFGFSPGKGQGELRKQMERKPWRNKSGTVSRGRSGLSPIPVALEIGSFPPSRLLCWLLLGGHKHLALVRGRGSEEGKNQGKYRCKYWYWRFLHQRETLSSLPHTFAVMM